MTRIFSTIKCRQNALPLFLATVMLLCGLFLAVSGVRANDPSITPYSMDFYGEIQGARAGDVVTVHDGAGVLRGRFVVTRDGYYGFVHVYGEPGLQGKDLNFALNGTVLTPLTGEPVRWVGDGPRVKVDFTRR